MYRYDFDVVTNWIKSVCLVLQLFLCFILQLIVRDRDVLTDSVTLTSNGNTMCSVVNDPHIVTFDQL